MKKMEAYQISLKTIAGKVGFYLSQSIRLSIELNLKTRLAALVVLTAMLMPVIFVGNWQAASAQSIARIALIPAPVSAPPEAFVISSTNTFSTALVSSVTTLNTFAASGYTFVVGFFVAPAVPEGLSPDLAKPVAPVAALAASITSSFGAVPGLIAPSSASSAKSAASLKSESAASAESAAPAAPVMTAPGSVRFDFDGDGKTDAARWQPSTGQWTVRQSGSGNALTTESVGTSSSIIAPADYNGDGKTDYAVFNSGNWTIKYKDGALQPVITFGQAGDKPVSGDYDGDGVADLALWRASNATWYVRQSGNGQVSAFAFGASDDIPVPGNYDGDSRMDYAVYRPSTGNWFIQGSSAGFSSAQWGNSTDIPVPADFDGDGKTDFAVYRANAGTWYVNYSNGTPYSTISWGNYGDQPAAADYDGDGRADIAVWRPTNGVWYISKSATGAFESFALGATDDKAVPAAYYKQIGGQVYSYDFARTRLSPKNATGGTNLYSRNFSWGTGLAGLPGRAGLDAGLGISYNSLVWTKEGSTMVFDADGSNVSPGFRLGFPVIEQAYYDSGTGKYNYLMVTPSGAKAEFRQTTASNIYETADSSYAQLKIHGNNDPNVPPSDLTITVTGTDGTQMSYAWVGGAYRCTQIKDANGNYITVVHNEYGLLRQITDTLGRVITVNYDSDSKPVNITQNRQTNNGSSSTIQAHTYATFNYTSQPVNPNFGTNITSIYGPQGTNVKLLQSIVYTDNSSTRFDYNSYGQVFKVSSYAADNHQLNHTRVNLSNADLSAAQADCPRFSETRNYVENFNGGNETVVANTIIENQTYNIGGASGTATKIEVSMTGEPTNRVSRTYVGASGWMEGLPVAAEDWANENGSYGQRRWTTTAWTQDNTNLSYILNPRVTETKVGDATNTKRTTVDYITQSGITLPGAIKVYDTNQTTVLKSSLTEYNWDTAYLSRRIIGLPVKSEAYGLNQSNNQFELVSKVTYAYDEGDFTGDATVNQNISTVIYHDNTNYGAGFIVGRGNQTSATRWNAAYPTSSGEAVTSSVLYNTAGAPVKQITPGSGANPARQVKIDYTDVFSDGANRNTFAYPTKITDPAGNFSDVKYRYDIGANVWARSPAPHNQTQGKITERNFDSIGRLERQTIVNNGGAYTRYEYPANGVLSKVFSTVTDTNDNNVGDTGDEVLSESWFDGAGRVRQSRTPLKFGTNGSATAWAGTLVDYDIAGRVKRQSVPTEVDANWTPAGDDLTRGWLWTSQEYDWKGRVTKQVNTDGTDKLISYDGCGCAGGQITTIQGELVPRDDQPTVSARRTQKAYDDIQGRTYKAEVLNWDATVYSTTRTTFDGRDQATLVRQYAGADTSSTFQDSTALYDGHGRISKTHKPEQQNPGGTAASTTYNYNRDDSIQSVVDARGASTNYVYNSRGLVEQISSTTPDTVNIPLSPTVSFVYDNIGNRTSMTDGLGSVSYEYNQLSQLTAETRSFTDSLPNAPLAGNGFKLEYTYSLSGQLKSYKDPYGQQINYAQDKIGRLTSVTGSTFGGVTDYASNPQYRAWGGLKSLSYGNGTQMSMTFNNRLQVNHHELNKTGQTTAIMSKNYDYYADGSLQKLTDAVDNRFDRLNTYDNLGRVKTGKTGAEARGGTVAPADMEAQLPYRQSYEYNAFNNMTRRDNLHWGRDYWNGQSNNLSYTYQNNRITNPYWTYDADGRVLASSSPDDSMNSIYDALGQLISLQGASNIYRFYTGDGREGKRRKLTQTGSGSVEEINYYIRSSVLGGEVISEIEATGRKRKTYVRAAGATLAWQTAYYNPTNNTQSEYINFENWDASGLSYRSTMADGATIYGEGSEGSPAELDPLGGNVGLSTPYQQVLTEPEPVYPSLQNLYDESPMMVNGQRVTATMDGMEVPVSFALNALNKGSAIPASIAWAQNLPGFRFESAGLGIFRTTIPWDIYRNTTSGRTWGVPNGYSGPAADGARISEGGTFISSWNLQQQTQKQTDNVPPVNIETLTAGLQELTSDPNCLPFIEKLINKADELRHKDGGVAKGQKYPPISTSFWNIFNQVANQKFGGFSYEPKSMVYKDRQIRINTIGGTFADGNATVFLVQTTNRANASANMLQEARYALHEIIHLAGQSSATTGVTVFNYYHDDILARAASEISGKKLPDGNDVVDFSNFWNKELLDNCRPSNLRGK